MDTIKNSGVTLVAHRWLTVGTTLSSSRRTLSQKTVHSLRHHVDWLLTGLLPLPNRDLYRERPRVSSFWFHYLLFSCRPSSSCWRLLPRVRATSFLYLSFNNARFRRQFLHMKMVFFRCIVCRTFFSSFTLCCTVLRFSHDRSSWSPPSLLLTTFQNFWDISDHGQAIFRILDPGFESRWEVDVS